MSPEMSAPNPGMRTAGVVDPSLLGGQAQIGSVDPMIRILAANSGSVDPAVKAAKLQEAEDIADRSPNVVATDSKGTPHKGREYPDVFSFNGELVGKEGVTPPQTHVVIETDDGHAIVIKKEAGATPDAPDTYDLMATSHQAGRTNEPLASMKFGAEAFQDGLVVPGEPFVFTDPATGKRISTRSSVTRITSFDYSDEGIVPEGHSMLDNPNAQSDVFSRVNQALQLSLEADALSSTPELTVPFGGMDRDTVMQYYFSGATQQEFANLGVNPAEVEAHIKQLPDDERESALMVRKEATAMKEAKQKLMESVPELFEGKVPPELESLIIAAGYDEYAVAFNQHDAIDTLYAANSYLNEQGGVELLGYNIDQRFIIHDSSAPVESYPLGYYGQKAGRFVYALPVDSSKASGSPRQEVSLPGAESIPTDVFVTNTNGEEVVNKKYCAGFIDSDQVFHANPLFMKSKAELAQPKRERERVRVVGEQVVKSAARKRSQERTR